MSDQPRLGFIGLGLMGRPIALRLFAAGYAVTVIILMCVTDQHATESVLFGPDSIAAGVDTRMLPSALKGRFADSLPLQVFGARMAARRFEPPLGAVSIMLKDLEKAAAVAKDKGVPLPMARTAAELYRLPDAQGRGAHEPTALVELLAGKR